MISSPKDSTDWPCSTSTQWYRDMAVGLLLVAVLYLAENNYEGIKNFMDNIFKSDNDE